MRIIIVGASAIGSHLARLLSRSNHDIVLMDESEDKLDAISSEYDLMTLTGSPTEIKALRSADTDLADIFIAVTPDENANMTSCAMAHVMGAKKTVAQVTNYELVDADNTALIRQMGIDNIIHPEKLAADTIVKSLKLSWVRQRWDVHGGSLVMLGIKLRESCEILNQPLRLLCGPQDPYHIVAIKRGNETVIPGGNDELRLYDIVYFMTTTPYIAYIRKIVGKEHYADVKNLIIMGGGKTAIRAAKQMPTFINTKLIEIDERRCERLNEELDDTKVMVIHGDGRDINLLKEENIKNTQGFVALTGNDEINILACLNAKKLGVRKTIAMIDNSNYLSMAESLDIGTVINKKMLAAGNIYQMMLSADVQNIGYLPSVRADVAEFTAQPGSKVTQKKVYELGLPRGCTIGGLVRGKEGLLVSGGTQIEAGDNVVVICYDLDLKKIEKFFSK
ncbi:MAG: Trk system potassium transporter TrkA [Prevotella sp.]|nr:Trk system potassium transporter TrkA [Prevotella sp.]MBQ4295671.1 Trk system potassium transporter TrkA [Prevotella sp.]MBR7053853.1 Trk system potassium transporter TrkA [Prevotella sp.]